MELSTNLVCLYICVHCFLFSSHHSVESILATIRYHSLVDFSSVYGIGPTNARKLYDLGLRTIDDLERYYEVDEGDFNLGPEEIDNGMETQRLDMSIKVALRLRPDMMEK
jgi:hypothetical protein